MMMQKLAAATTTALLAFCSPTWANGKDSQGNFYIDGLPPDQIVSVLVYDSSNSPPAVQLREEPVKYPCGVRVLFESKKFRFLGNYRLDSSLGPIQFSEGDLGSFEYPNPCDGPNVVSRGWQTANSNYLTHRIARAVHPCFWQYQYQGQTKCQPAKVIYIADLPPGVPVTARSGVSYGYSYRYRMLKISKCGYLKIPNTAKYPTAGYFAIGVFADNATRDLLGYYDPASMPLSPARRCSGGVTVYAQ
jgi:hypothetical protein